MNAVDTNNPARPPNLVSALLSGFDTITNHLSLILFPLLLDLFLWFGPRLRLGNLINELIVQINKLPGADVSEVSDLMQASQEIWRIAAARFNLLASLRSYPVGIPSLMTSRSPLETPLGSPSSWQLSSWNAVFLAWVGLFALGIFVGTLYYAAVAQVTLQGNISWLRLLRGWPNAFWRVASLTLIWGALLVVLSIPVSLVFSAIASIGSWIAQFMIFLLAGFLIWLLLPLLFSAHGIFVNGLNTVPSLRHGVRLTQMTLPTTGLFFLSFFVIDQGLNFLWRVPPEASWFSLVGVIGHAFVVSALLAASFVYYRDADRWITYVLQRFRQSTAL